MSASETEILQEAARTVYDRPDQHGTPESSFNSIAQFWSDYLEHDISPEDVAKMMILLKMARSKEGHYDKDNPVDVAGYCECWARLQ